MPSENKTPLGLSQWLGKDRPKREDFNSDNQKIDLACRSALSTLSEHLEEDIHPSSQQRQHWDEASRHMGEGITSPDGLHGLRYWEGNLQVNLGGVWAPCGSGGTASGYQVFGVRIDTTNPDPAGAVSYTDDAVGMTPGSAAWDETFLGSIRPCLLKNGVPLYYLDPQDYTRKFDGTPADITSGADGDVMVEIPRIACAIYREGDDLCVRLTNHPQAASLDERFVHPGHTRMQDGDRNFLYIGAYLGREVAGKLRSLSGEVPTAMSTSPESFRAAAQAGGAGYDLLAFYPLLLLQCMFLVRFCSRDAQEALGMGYVSAPVMSGAVAAGGADKKGLFFGEQSGLQQMKAFGIEDLWGNLATILDGLRTDEDCRLWVATQNFAQPEFWHSTGRGETMPTNFTKFVYGDNELGLMSSDTGGSTTTYWCDAGSYKKDAWAILHSHYMCARDGGMFNIQLLATPNAPSLRNGGRIMYL